LEDEIRQIQQLLREISFFDENIERVVPDGIYGDQTRRSVESFQRANNLYVTGEVDNDTWDKIFEVHEEIQTNNKRNILISVINEEQIPFNVGDRDASLYVVQAMILALSDEFDNIDAVTVNGIYDEETQKAVEVIQIISGLDPNAQIDREFINALSELYMTYITRDHVENSDTIRK
jgi:peptidoglycan hydrolase-like protein with peptidoglycan-binding domain